MALEKFFANVRRALAGSKPGLEGKGQAMGERAKKDPRYTPYN